jgi:hypothetical protein
MKPVQFVSEFCDALARQITSDQERHGDTWRRLPAAGQEDRIYARILSYLADYHHSGEPFPWLKVAGLALIAWIRENKEDWYLGQDPRKAK